jgi:cob(I)alamin adenosyltransferase
MKIYTKTGDKGETGLFGGPRVRKDHPRIEAYGTVDELNSVLGLVRAHGVGHELDLLLARMQNELFSVGAELAAPNPDKKSPPGIVKSHIEYLERAIDRYEAEVPPLRQFILPAGTLPAAALHLARTVCRRAERRLVTLDHLPGETVSPELIIYLNRVSDLLFVLARVVNRRSGAEDVPWEKP